MRFWQEKNLRSNPLDWRWIEKGLAQGVGLFFSFTPSIIYYSFLFFSVNTNLSVVFCCCRPIIKNTTGVPYPPTQRRHSKKKNVYSKNTNLMTCRRHTLRACQSRPHRTPPRASLSAYRVTRTLTCKYESIKWTLCLIQCWIHSNSTAR